MFFLSEKHCRSRLNQMKTCVHETSILSISNRSSFIEHQHTSRHTFQHVHTAHVHGYSVILGNHLRVTKKEMSRHKSIFIAILFETLQHLWTFLFSRLSLSLYALRAVTVTEQTHGYLILGRLLILYSNYTFRKCIKLCTKHTLLLLAAYFYLSMLFH